MTTTLKSLRGDGAKCEKVATDFWECTDKGGTVWWCSSSGCIKKPTKSTGDGEHECHDSESDLFAKIGRTAYLAEIQQEARETLAAMPSGSALSRLNAPGQAIMERLTTLMLKAASAEEWSGDDLQAFMGEMTWAQKVLELEVALRLREKDASDGGLSVNCVKVYNDCMNNHNCSGSDWFCLCCIPCSIKYSRCVAGDIFSVGLFAR
jgi:hypothetical protein